MGVQRGGVWGKSGKGVLGRRVGIRGAQGVTGSWRELRYGELQGATGSYRVTGSSGELQGTDRERLGRGVWGGQGSVERGTGGVLSGGERPDTQRDGKMGD